MIQAAQTVGAERVTFLIPKGSGRGVGWIRMEVHEGGRKNFTWSDVCLCHSIFIIFILEAPKHPPVFGVLALAT